jgi:hypothetical protein
VFVDLVPVVAASTSPLREIGTWGVAIWLQLSQRWNPFKASQIVDRGTVTDRDPAAGLMCRLGGEWGLRGRFSIDQC